MKRLKEFKRQEVETKKLITVSKLLEKLLQNMMCTMKRRLQKNETADLLVS